MKLIVNTGYKGHHSEYLDHFFKSPLFEKNIYILHPKYIQTKSKKLKNKIKYYEYEPKNSLLNKINELKLINEVIKKHQINKCILLNFNYYFFCMALYSINVERLSAIYYLPHFYDNKLNIVKKKLKNFIFKLIQAKTNLNIFILNDPLTVNKLNKQFKNNFKVLSDPVVKNTIVHTTNNKKTTNFLFIGEISERKGIYILLKVLESFSSIKQTFNFSIAGNAPIKKQKILDRISNIKNKNPDLINFFNLDRISNKMFDELMHKSDVILCLHQITEGSSGIIGKAILHNKIVIGPNTGLISSIILNNKLGITTDVACYKSVIYEIRSYISNRDKYYIDKKIREDYLKNHSPEKFVKELLDV